MSGVGRECDLMRHRQGRERRGKRTGRELTTSEVGRRNDQGDVLGDGGEGGEKSREGPGGGGDGKGK